jgi:Tol biopolymer transport system component
MEQLSRSFLRALVIVAGGFLLFLLGLSLVPEEPPQPIAERPTASPPPRTHTSEPTARPARVQPSPTPSPQPISMGTLPTGSLLFSAWHSEPSGGNCESSIGIYQTNREDGQAHFLTNGCNLLVAPTADQIVYTKNGLSYHMDLTTKVTRQLHTGSTDTWPTSWSPDGKTLLLLGGFPTGDVFRYTLPDGPSELLLDVPDAQGISYASWAPTGTLVALSQRDMAQQEWHLLVLDVADGTLRPLDQCASMGDWAPDGTRLACLTADATIVIVELDGTDGTVIGTMATPRWAPDGMTIAFAGTPDEGQAQSIGLWDVEHGPPRFLGFSDGPSGRISLVWAPDSRTIALKIDAGTAPWPGGMRDVPVADIWLMDVRSMSVRPFAEKVHLSGPLAWVSEPE